MKKKKYKWLLGLVVIGILMGSVYVTWGGMDTGRSFDVDTFSQYAKKVEEINVPADKKIIALGEATHGNVEFQQLKLEVFQQLVENNGVRGFALEGDYGGCREVNRYIHGGKGTAQEAVAKIGFSIYRTKEMEDLVDYMRTYNESAPEGEDIRFYGFDMQRTSYSFAVVAKACKEYGIPFSLTEDTLAKDPLESVRLSLEESKADENILHCVDMLLQYDKIQDLDTTEGGDLRDTYMAENVKWILQQEEARGKERLFITGHNSHVAKWESYASMGQQLAADPTAAYYVIGTDFYHTKCNLPKGKSSRTLQSFYSHDPLAKTAKKAGFEECWLDFATIPDTTSLMQCANDYTFLGNLGESYTFMMRLLPQSYRMFQPPAVLYDSMILVSEAHPTTIKS